ncbi:MAG TPA: VPLPA-CTERM sorting domain-containing protein [Geobacteraceae bacterium]|nr:VPLPA-CTERM sorting domain-containing protein [Geobacteraceae bacterium]
MKKKIMMLLAVMMLLFGVSGQAMATLTTGDLIRVVYKSDGTGIEVATDLAGATGWTSGSAITSPVNYSADTFSLTQFAGSAWSDLSVAYYANTFPSGSFWFSGPDGGLNNSASKKNSITTALTQMNGIYSTAMGTGKMGTVQSSNANSHWNKMNMGGTNIGSWGTYVGHGMGVVSLADLVTTGFVDQYLYYYPSATSNNAGTGVQVAKIRTYADGTTQVSAVSQVPEVPVPAALYLFGTGLLGLIGIRRKKAA